MPLLFNLHTLKMISTHYLYTINTKSIRYLHIIYTLSTRLYIHNICTLSTLSKRYLRITQVRRAVHDTRRLYHVTPGAGPSLVRRCGDQEDCGDSEICHAGSYCAAFCGQDQVPPV